MSHFTRQELNRWLDAGLPGRRLRHLEQCDACALEARRFRAMVDGLRQLPQVTPAPGFEDRVMARIEDAVSSAPAPQVRVPERYQAKRLWAAAASVGTLSLASTAAAVAWVFQHDELAAGWIRSGWTAARSTGQGLTHQIEALLSTDVAQSAWQTLVDHGGAILAGSAATMSLYIIGCAALVRLLRTPRPVHAFVSS